MDQIDFDSVPSSLDQQYGQKILEKEKGTGTTEMEEEVLEELKTCQGMFYTTSGSTQPGNSGSCTSGRIKGLIAIIIAVALLVISAVAAANLLGSGGMYFLAAEGGIAVLGAMIVAFYLCCRKKSMDTDT